MSYKGGHPCRTGVGANATGAVNKHEHVCKSTYHSELLIEPYYKYEFADKQGPL